MERRAFAVTPMHPIKDKRARLRVAARYIKMGVVRFPRTGCEQLLTQLLGFGGEKHDDAVDALVYLILGLVGDGIEGSKRPPPPFAGYLESCPSAFTTTIVLVDGNVRSFAWTKPRCQLICRFFSATPHCLIAIAVKLGVSPREAVVAAAVSHANLNRLRSDIEGEYRIHSIRDGFNVGN
jgi:hypothetical protein